MQASLKSGEEAAYTEEANAQLPVEDAGTGFGGMTVPQREITVADALFTVQTAIIHFIGNCVFWSDKKKHTFCEHMFDKK